MSAFDKAAARLEAAVFAQMADVGEYDDGTGPREVQVIIDRDVEQRDMYETSLPARRHEAEFLRHEVPRPKRGHTVIVCGQRWVWDGLIADDGFIVRGHVNEG